MEFKKISIMCPKCKHKVLTWNGITKMQMATRCSYCHTGVIFDPTTNTTTAKRFDYQYASSGRTFGQ